MHGCIFGAQCRSDALTDAVCAMQMWRPSHSLRTWRSCASSQSSMPSGKTTCLFTSAVWGSAGECGGHHEMPSMHLTPMWCVRRTGTYFCMDKSVTAVVIQV